MADFWRFVRAVTGHYYVLVGGGAAIVGVLQLGERLAGIEAPIEVYLALLAALFVYACFLAWRHEYSTVEALRGQVVHGKPALVLNIEQLSFTMADAAEGGKFSVVIAMVMVSNRGSVAGAVPAWGARIELDGITHRGRRNRIKDQFKAVFPDKTTMTFYEKDSLDLKTLEPIQPGGFERGILMFLFDKSLGTTNAARGSIVVSLTDSFGSVVDSPPVNAPPYAATAATTVFPGIAPPR